MTVSVILVDHFSQQRIGRKLPEKRSRIPCGKAAGVQIPCRQGQPRPIRVSSLVYGRTGEEDAIDHKFYGRKSQDEDRMRNI